MIPAFTQQDFLYTSAPYEFLYQFQDDKFAYAQLREQMKVYAASIGVKGFIGLFNAYLESQQKTGGVPMDNATAFDDQPLELYSGPYTCDIAFTLFKNESNEHTYTYSDLPVHDDHAVSIPSLARNRHLHIVTKISQGTTVSFNFEVAGWGEPLVEQVSFN